MKTYVVHSSDYSAPLEIEAHSFTIEQQGGGVIFYRRADAVNGSGVAQKSAPVAYVRNPLLIEPK